VRTVFVAVIVIVAAIVAAVIGGNARWRRHTAQMVDRLSATHAARAHELSIDQLPAPAARYLRKALLHPLRRVRSAVATQDASFFINGGWRPLLATQHFTTAPPGFVWDARIEMAPLVPAQVRDAYVSGRASMQASIYGLYSIVDVSGTPELNAGALQRFLGEAVWFPSALLPSREIAWDARDDRSATVTLTDGATRVSLVFEFDGKDDVVRISGDRYKETNGSYVMQPWVIECSNHQDRSGMRIPTVCEVAWIGAKGPEPYWRGRITSIDYNFWH
jgi:hypothetical protein